MFLMTQDKAFFDLFDRAAENMVHTAEVFHDLVRNFDRRTELAEAIHVAEQVGDSITHDTIRRLDQTFITPLDREDIHRLITQTDEVVNRLEAAARRIILYKVERPTEDVARQAEIALQTTRAAAQAIKQVRNFKQQDHLSKLLIEIHAWENRADELNHAALARLFESQDPMYVLKWKEIYELVESATDACELVANVIRSIMVKNA